MTGPTHRGALAETRSAGARGFLRRSIIAVTVTASLILIGLSLVSRFMPVALGQSCQAVARQTTVRLAPDQMDNAASITAIAAKRGLPARAATIAIATAMQESKLRNLTHGDRDSLGLFQQRPSQGWGTEEQILDVDYAINAFYDALIKVPGWETGEITAVAQEVQRSAYPLAYAKHEMTGRVLASTLSGYTQAALTCELRTSSGGDLSLVASQAKAEFGITLRPAGHALTYAASSPEQAWSLAQWAVAHADRTGISEVALADQVWRRDDGGSWRPATSSAGSSTVVISAPE